MQNFKFYMDENMLHNNYNISKSDKVYSYFNCEYKNHSKDYYGNIILPHEISEHKNKLTKILRYVKESVLRDMQYKTISRSSLEHAYFISEYNNIDTDSYHNVIIPMENQKTYVK